MTDSLSASQPIAEAVRTLLGQQQAVLLEYESEYRKGDRKRGVHQMRVALRRMRALTRLYGDRFEPEVLDELVSGMRRTGKRLGAVRDLDVVLTHLEEYRASQPDDERAEVDPLIRATKVRRRAARKRLVRYLDGKRYRTFLERLGEFAAQPGLGVADDGDGVVPRQVRHVLGSTIWRRYEAVWAFGPVLDGADDETLHELRIECKYLRYSLEFFREVLGETKAGRLIAPVVAMQEFLGDLHDTSVAGETLERVDDGPGVVRDRYLASRTAGAGEMRDEFPAMWAKLDNERYRRNLAAMLAAL